MRFLGVSPVRVFLGGEGKGGEFRLVSARICGILGRILLMNLVDGTIPSISKKIFAAIAAAAAALVLPW